MSAGGTKRPRASLVESILRAATLTSSRRSISLMVADKKRGASSGEGAAMGQSDALQRAAERLDMAVEELEAFLRQAFAETEDGVSLANLREKVRFLTEERDRLIKELDAEKARAHRLAAANDEVSGRLGAVMVTLKDLMPANPR
jgi:hypothetical protein